MYKVLYSINISGTWEPVSDNPQTSALTQKLKQVAGGRWAIQTLLHSGNDTSLQSDRSGLNQVSALGRRQPLEFQVPHM